MATVKFILQSKNDNAPIYVRFSISAKESFKRKTRETINPENWNAKKGTPKNITSANQKTLTDLENLKQKLTDIESFVLDHYKKRDETEIINGIWLDEIIQAYYSGGRRLQQLDYLDNYLDY